MYHLFNSTLAEAQPEPEPSSSSVMIGPTPSPDMVSSSTSSVAGGDATSNPSPSPTAPPGGSGSNSAPSIVAGICISVSIMACMNWCICIVQLLCERWCLLTMRFKGMKCASATHVQTLSAGSEALPDWMSLLIYKLLGIIIVRHSTVSCWYIASFSSSLIYVEQTQYQYL